MEETIKPLARKALRFFNVLIVVSLLLGAVTPVAGAAERPTSRMAAVERISAAELNEIQTQFESALELVQVLTMPRQGGDVPMAGPPALELWAWADPNEATPGDVVTYTIALHNYGVDPIESIQVEATLAEGVNYVPSSASAGMDYDPAEKRVTWLVQTLMSGETVRGQYQGRLTGRRLRETVEQLVTAQVGEDLWLFGISRDRPICSVL